MQAQAQNLGAALIKDYVVERSEIYLNSLNSDLSRSQDFEKIFHKKWAWHQN